MCHVDKIIIIIIISIDVMDVFTNLVLRIVSQKYIYINVYQNVSFTYLQFIHASFTSIEVELESNEEKGMGRSGNRRGEKGRQKN